VNIEDIYNELDEDFEYELACEELFLRPRYDVVPIFNAAKQAGKTIACLSDMYLPKNFIEKILTKFNLSPDHLYVSGSDLVAKFDGSMFHSMLRDLRVRPESVLHIGDNEVADYAVPARLRLQAIHITNGWPSEDEERRISSQVAERLANLGWRGSQVAAALRDARFAVSPTDMWEEIGLSIAGPLAFCFGKWVHSRAAELEANRAGFLARDTWLPKRAFEQIDGSVSVSYLHLNRTTLCRASLLTPSKALLRQLRSMLPATPVEIAQRLGFTSQEIARELSSLRWTSVSKMRNEADLEEWINQIHTACPEMILEIAEARRAVGLHLDNAGAFVDPDKFLLVDIGWAGTSSALLSELFPEARRWTHLFMGTSGQFLSSDLKHNELFFGLGLPDHHSRLFFECIEVVETLMTSAQETVIKLVIDNGKVREIHQQLPPELSSQRSDISRMIDHAEKFIDLASNANCFQSEWNPDRHIIYSLIEFIIRTGDVEILRLFTSVRHQVEVGSSDWKPFVDVSGVSYVRTLSRWLRGKSVKSPRGLAWHAAADTLYRSSLSGWKFKLANLAFTLGRKRRKR
jgi:hypothetical protein